ncbi:39305_t:CDS:1, partial [Gigaspora margarita]
RIGSSIEVRSQRSIGVIMRIRSIEDQLMCMINMQFSDYN